MDWTIYGVEAEFAEVVGNVWQLATVQTWIIHLIRNTFRLASRRDRDAIKHDVKPIYTAVNATAATTPWRRRGQGAW